MTWLDEVPLDTPSCALGLGVWHGAGGERACCEGVSNSHDGSNVSLFCSASAQRGRGLVAVVYVSEGKSQGVVDALETVARDVCATHGAQVVNVFRDVEYNRTGFTLGARVPPSASIDDAHPTTVEPLRSVAVALAERAWSLVDLRSHAAAHPRCGVVDHISCHAIGEVDESLAAALARGIGERVGTLGVPALLYGSASATRVTLADLRRRHGYFRETGGTGAWSGAHVMEGGDVDADYGPRVVPPAAGVVMLGSTPWVCSITRARRCAMDRRRRSLTCRSGLRREAIGPKGERTWRRAAGRAGHGVAAR